MTRPFRTIRHSWSCARSRFQSHCVVRRDIYGRSEQSRVDGTGRSSLNFPWNGSADHPTLLAAPKRQAHKGIVRRGLSFGETLCRVLGARLNDSLDRESRGFAPFPVSALVRSSLVASPSSAGSLPFFQCSAVPETSARRLRPQRKPAGPGAKRWLSSQPTFVLPLSCPPPQYHDSPMNYLPFSPEAAWSVIAE